MNSLYHIAILEGYLSQHPELPRNVQDAIAFFKQAGLSAGSPSLTQNTKQRKKPKLTPEQRIKNLENLARMREIAARNREIRGQKVWNPDRKAKVTAMREAGKSRQEIARAIGVSTSALDTAVSKFRL